MTETVPIITGAVQPEGPIPEPYFLRLQHGYFVYADWLWKEIGERLKNDKNVLGLITGQTGSGKTCLALKCATKLDDSFSIDQVVFNYHQFRQAIENSKDQAWIVWDEPNKGLSHRDWYLDVNKAITTYLQTFRFRHKNVLFALPKATLIDKSARVVCLFEGIMQHEGLAKIYQYFHNHFGSPEIYKKKRGEVETTMPSRDLMKAYYEKREEFHRTEFPEEKEEPRKGQSIMGRIYETVRKDTSRYEKDNPRTGTKELSPALIAADLGCSGEIARRVRDKIMLEKRVQPLEGKA